VTIAAGGSVTFRNDDDRAHTVTANDGGSTAHDRRRRVVEADVQAGRDVLVPVRDPSRDDRQGRGEGHIARRNPEAEALPDAKPASKPTATGVDAEIRDFAFAPSSISVPLARPSRGGTRAPPRTPSPLKTARSTPRRFRGGSWARTFDTGRRHFTYVCAFHPAD
jgi:plastocyanin